MSEQTELLRILQDIDVRLELLEEQMEYVVNVLPSRRRRRRGRMTEVPRG
jgi:hypothetical protein